jgi:putative ABC transport system permease protein
MLRNYLLTSFRNFYRNLGYSTINIAGLAVGLTASILIFLWVLDERGMNKFHQDSDRIYHVLTNYVYTNGTIETTMSTPGAMAPALQNDFPEVEHTARIDWGWELLLKHGEKGLIEHGCWGDPSIFSIFSFPIVKGDKINPMPNVNSIAISESTAARFFNTEDAIGKIFRVSEKYDMTVTAVFKDIPTNSTINFNFLLPYEIKYKENPWLAEWSNTNDNTYVKLKKNASAELFKEKLKPYIKTKCTGCITDAVAQRFDETYLYSRWQNGQVDGGRIEYVNIFTVVAIFVLLIACINFMNLATARSATRSREVGVRKVVGAQRGGLILQFIGESMLVSVVSLLFAIILVQLLIPLFNDLIKKKIVFDLTDPLILFSLLAIVLLTGFTAGSYPAFFLSSFRPAKVLKGQVHSNLSGAGLRKSLVVFQFVLSIILIVGSIVAYNQISYIRNKNLGMDRNNVVYFDIHDGLGANRESFRNEAKKSPSITNVTYSGHIPFDHGSMTLGVSWKGKPADDITPFSSMTSDEEYLPAMGITLLEGRNFNGAIDSLNYLVNEAFAENMGLSAKEAVGASVTIWGNEKGKIIGVFQNYHANNLKRKIGAMFISYNPQNTWRVFAKINGANRKEALKVLEQSAKKFDPAYPFEYHFLDDRFDELYRSESTIQNLAIGFTIVAIFISCLGLFGLASFTAERRKKEIGIRKAMGASVVHLIVLLCTDFTKLVVVALVIGMPIAWYFMNQFLNGYEYHAALSWWVFAATASAILLIALATVIYQSAKAAVGNPVESLRSE